MAAPDLRGFIQIGFDILNTTVNTVTSKILAQIGNAHKETTESDQVEWWQHVGLATRPSKPEAKRRAAQAVVIRCGDHDVCVASQDLRGLSLYGNLDYGETCLYAAGEDGTAQGRVLIKDNGAISLITTDDNTPTGKVVALTLGPTGLKFTAPWGSFTFDATGFHLKTKAGPRIDMGGISIPGLPDSLTAPLSGYCKITAPVFKAEAANVYLGAGSTFFPSVYAPVVPAYPPPVPMQAVQIAALTTFGTALAAAFTASAAPSASAAASAVTAATAVLTAAFSSAPPPVQSSTVWTSI